MFRPRIIPALLLLNRGLVKTVKFKNPTYVGDPINAVRIFNDLRADELVFLDITATKENRLPPLDLLRDISEEAFMPFAAGGGIKSAEDAKKIIDAGAEKVVINSAAVNPQLISDIADHFGSQSVIVSIDAKKNFFGKYKVCTRSATQTTDMDVVKHAVAMEEAGAGEIMINSVEKDGTMTGYDYDLIKMVTDAVRIPVIACGGAGKVEHLSEAVLLGNASAVAAGSMFVFQGPRRAVLINYPDSHELEVLFQ